MERIPTRDFLKAINGKTNDSSCLPAFIDRINLDSRKLTSGDVFWAIRGKMHDGHQFVETALQQGAVTCIVEETYRDHQSGKPLIYVENTLTALQQFARWYRTRCSLTSIGITGSYGKTTTRELLHSVLSVKKAGIQSQFNYNNEIGVPLTVLSLLSHHEYLIVEMGAAKPDDIRPLAEISQPHFGIITGIGPSHLGGFKSIEHIVQTKGDLIARLPKQGFAVIAGDNSWTEELRRRSRSRVLTVGVGPENTYFATRIESLNHELRFQTEGKKYRLSLAGRHHVTTGLSVIAVATELGYAAEDIQQGFDCFQPVPGRGRIVQHLPWTVIDDTYNANPASCRAACEMLGAWQTTGRRLLVLGDMLDLGERAGLYHEELGEIAAKSGIDILFTLGQQGDNVSRGVQKAGSCRTEINTFSDAQDLIQELTHRLRESDVVLVKGSRGMRMERILQSIIVNEPALNASPAA
jgi:UDP-N-acetylmuramoyl-tripeptide--D-alanyl-D-alanine ligase